MEDNIKSKKQEMLKIKFTAYVIPKIKWDSKLNKFTTVASNKNFREDILKLMREEGDTPEETQKLKFMKTQILLQNKMISLNEVVDIFHGSVNDKESREFYYKDEIVNLPKQEAEYYLSQMCGGDVIIKNEHGKLEKTFHMKNIDNQPGYYKHTEMARFKREHSPLPVAEIYNG